jgi:hypothetical protein
MVNSGRPATLATYPRAQARLPAFSSITFYRLDKADALASRTRLLYQERLLLRKHGLLVHFV